MKNTKIYTLIIAWLMTSTIIFYGNMMIVSAAAPLGNLIVNPNMQIGPPNNVPTNWNLEGFSDVFTGNYPVTGPLTGDVAAQIITTVHNNGDAKWVFDNVPVSEGALYTFSDSYNSSVPTSLIAAFTPVNGTVPTLFTTFASLASSNGVWQTATKTFTVPLGYNSVTVYHAIANVGTLTTANYSLVFTASATDNLFPEGIVSLTFDDGWSSQYDNALPILKNANLKGTFFIVSQRMLDANNVGLDNLLSNIAHPDLVVTANTNSVTWSNIFTDPTNNSYRFTDFYTSTQPSTVEISYKLNNVVTTTTLGILPASPNIPSRANFVFTLPGLPSTVSPISINHQASLGNLAVTNSTLTGYDLYMNTNQILEAQANGIEIANHTVNHCDLVSGLCPDGVIHNSTDPLTAVQEIQGAKSTLTSLIPSLSDTFSYPYGSYSTSTQSYLTISGINTARTVNAGFNTKYSDKLALNTQIVDSTTPLTKVYDWIDSALMNKWWLTLTFHQVENQSIISSNGDTAAVTPETLTSIVDYLNSHGVQVKTINESAALMSTSSTSTSTVFTINATAGANGIISPIGTTTVNMGTNQTYLITPDSGFNIMSLLVDGATTTASTTYTFTNVIANHTINASFVASSTTPTSTPTSTPPIAGNNGNGGSGAGTYIPGYIEAINVPLIISSEQSGRAIFDLGNGRKITIYVPVQGSSDEKIKINIAPIKLSFGDSLLQGLPTDVVMLNNFVFKMTATNQSGQEIKTLPKNLMITLDLNLPKDLSSTAVYYYDSVNDRWVIASSGIFDEKNNQVTFSINNLNTLSVMQSPSLARVIDYLMPKPLIITPVTTTTAVLGIKRYPNGSLIRTIDRRIYVILNGQRVHIRNLKQLAKYKGAKIINVNYEDVASIELK